MNRNDIVGFSLFYGEHLCSKENNLKLTQKLQFTI